MKKSMLLFAATLVLMGCESTPQATPQKMAIDSVYALDSRIVSGSQSLSEVAAKTGAVSLANTPEGFASAYKANTKAWGAFAQIEKDMFAVDMKKAQKDIGSFLSTYTSNYSEASVKLQALWPQFADKIGTAVAEIRKSRDQYILIGTQFGAIYPK